MRSSFANLGIRTKIIVCTILVLLIVVVMASLVYSGIVVSETRDQQVAQTTEIVSAIDALQLQLVNMELGYRGFLLVGDDASLKPYTSGYESYTRIAAQLRGLLADDSPRLEHLTQLDRAVQRWHSSVLENGITLRRLIDGTHDAGYTAFITGNDTGHYVFEELRVQVATFRAAEAERSVQRRQEAQVAAQNLKATLVVGSVLALIASLGLLWLLATRIARRIGHVTQAALRMADGARTARCTLAPARDEIGQLATAFNTMAAMIEQHTTDLQAQYTVADASRYAAETAHAQIAEQLALIDTQQAIIREMSVPVLPLTATTLVMPLVGALDSTRLGLIHTQALHALERTSAKQVLLDITGVPVVDTQVAQGLLQLVHMAKLMGAAVSIVGIRPEVAQALISLGLDLSKIRTYSTLQDGIGNLLAKNTILQRV